jgi:hypothetical protein
MQLYADIPAVRTRQLLTDLAVLLWALTWCVAGWVVYRLVGALAVFGRALEGAGGRLSGELGTASDQAGGVPFLGDKLSVPFRGAADASSRLAEAGLAEQQAVSRLAWTLALVVAVTPIAAALLTWLPWRLRWVRSAAAATALRGGGTAPDLELLALRALTRRPLRQLQAIAPRPVEALRDRDAGVVAALAALELRALGLRLPAGDQSATQPSAPPAAAAPGPDAPPYDP